MANLYSGSSSFSGYKTLAQLTGLTFTANKTYTIQIVPSCPYFYLREGTEGDGFICISTNPFTYTYDGENDLYIKYESGGTVYINISG